MTTFYDFTRAPSPRRARILLAEKAIPHETVQIDMMQAEQMGEAFRAINPDCTIPALRMETGEVLTSNAAIAAWAEAAYPEPPLLGVTPFEKAEIAHWNTKIEAEGLMAIAEALRNSNPAMKDRALPGPHDFAQIPELAARGAQRLKLFFDMFNQRMEGRDFVATDRFSIADITAIVVMDFAKVVRMQPEDDHVHLARWRARISERPSVQL